MNPHENAWELIETAPKDRLIILGRAESRDVAGIVSPGYWQTGWSDGVDEMGIDDGWVDCQFQNFHPSRTFGAAAYQFVGLQPTHWMPFPSAPVQS